jgi:murein L,D-transpeptidase YafK
MSRIAFFGQLTYILLLTIAVSGTTSANPGIEYVLEMHKSQQKLLVKSGNEIVRHYRAVSGRGGNGPKRAYGDRKTPIGVYRIIELRDNSQFHFFMKLDYPNLIDAWYGYRNEVIDANDFRAITAAFKENRIPPQDTPLGGYIGIHGIGELNDEKTMIHEAGDWTAGCIALTNDEIIDLKQYVTVGTKVIIHE